MLRPHLAAPAGPGHPADAPRFSSCRRSHVGWHPKRCSGGSRALPEAWRRASVGWAGQEGDANPSDGAGDAIPTDSVPASPAGTTFPLVAAHFTSWKRGDSVFAELGEASSHFVMGKAMLFPGAQHFQKQATAGAAGGKHQGTGQKGGKTKHPGAWYRYFQWSFCLREGYLVGNTPVQRSSWLRCDHS